MFDELFEEELDDFIKSMIEEEQKMTDDELLKRANYTGLFSEYLRRYHKTVDDDYSNIIPASFELSDDYEKKIQILDDALSKEIAIQESSYYPSLLEGVVVEEEKSKTP